MPHSIDAYSSVHVFWRVLVYSTFPINLQVEHDPSMTLLLPHLSPKISSRNRATKSESRLGRARIYTIFTIATLCVYIYKIYTYIYIYTQGAAVCCLLAATQSTTAATSSTSLRQATSLTGCLLLSCGLCNFSVLFFSLARALWRFRYR